MAGADWGLVVPDSQGEPGTTNLSSRRANQMEGTHMRVLVVDDSRATRAVLRLMLGAVGFDVMEACDGRDALDVLAENGPPDAALVDWNMPQMDGLSFVKAVRSDPAYERLPLLMVTTESEPAQVVRALSAGADEYAMKPFTTDVILSKLALLGVDVPAQR